MTRQACRSIAGRTRHAIIVSGLAVVLSASGAWADAYRCAGSKIAISGGKAADIELACAGVADAIAFLPKLGLALNELPAIELRSKRPWGEGWHSLGQYDTRRNVVKLLDLDAAIKRTRRGGPFGVTMSAALWRSYVAHELAHAAVHSRAPSLRFAAQEYIASVAQLGVLAADIRRHILENFPDATAFASEDQIRDEFYLADPCLFMVKSYLHFTVPQNGPRFISRLLATSSAAQPRAPSTLPALAGTSRGDRKSCVFDSH